MGLILLPWLASSAFAQSAAVPSQIEINIAVSVNSATAAGTVTVVSVAGSNVKLKVDESVIASLPSELEIPTAGIYPGDLEPGTKLLMFFREKGPGRWIASGHYELIKDGKIRDVPADVYISLTRNRAEKALTHRKPVVAPKAALSTAPTP
jgi:hypothetical protein